MSAKKGSSHSAEGRRWNMAVRKVLRKRSRSDALEELERLAEKYLDTVEKMGDSEKPSIAGYADLADRFDGKPAQAITGPDGGPVEITWRPVT